MTLHIIREVSGIDWNMAQTEYRKPAPRPQQPHSWDELNEYPRSVEDYINDYFGFRTSLIRLNSVGRYLFNISGSPEVLIGKDGWLYLARPPILDQHRGLNNFSENELQRVLQMLSSIRQYLEVRDIPVIFTIVPNKHTIYPEYLPSYLRKIGDSPLDQISRELERSHVIDFVDLRPILFNAKVKEQIYYKTDTHWNLKGAFYAYQILMQEIKKYYPETNILREDDYRFEQVFSNGGSHARFLAIDDILREESWRAVPTFQSKVEVDRRTKVSGIPGAFRIIRTSQKKALKILVFGDSFMLGNYGLHHFLGETFQEMILSHRENLRYCKEFVEKYKPDLVLIESAERSLDRFLKYPILEPENFRP